MRSSRVLFVGQAKTDFEALNRSVGEQIAKGKQNSEEIQLLRSIQAKTELLKQNPEYGDSIPKRMIPREYIETYEVRNLFRVELAHYWRMLYTIKGDKIEVVCFVLDVLDHRRYDKLFGYR